MEHALPGVSCVSRLDVSDNLLDAELGAVVQVRLNLTKGILAFISALFLPFSISSVTPLYFLPGSNQDAFPPLAQHLQEPA